MLKALLSLLLTVGLEAVLQSELSEPPRSSVCRSGSTSSALAKTYIDVAGQQSPQSVLPILAGEIFLNVRARVSLP